ncbi:Protein of unknown function [Gryllus bimaculatus]|nr:Protein of unknown function [Gryllus bimaculatus]
MDAINVLAESTIKLEEVKLEPDDHAEDNVWNCTEGYSSYSAKRGEEEEEDEEEELKPLVRVDIKEEFVGDEGQQYDNAKNSTPMSWP